MFIELILRFLLTYLLHDPAVALARTAPEPLSVEDAAAHFAASRVAALVHEVDPDMLLAIAARESHYNPKTRTKAFGKVACGVMTPILLTYCKPSGVLGGYLNGAAHLREWIDAKGLRKSTKAHPWVRESETLRGFAGGYHLIRGCRIGPMWLTLPNGKLWDACQSDVIVWSRQAWIRQERAQS